MQKIFSTPPQRMCILRLSAIGDTVHTLAVVRAIQAAWPSTKITWIIGAVEATLLGDIDNIDFIIFNKKWSAAEQKTFFKQLQVTQFDALLHMQVSLRASRIARKVKSPIKLGFDCKRAKDFQWLFSTHRIPHIPDQHSMDSLLGFANACGIAKSNCNHQYPTWDIPLSSQDKAFAAQHSNALIISPCSSDRSRNFRNWPADRYAEIIDYAAEQYQLKTVLTGGTSGIEKQYAETLMATCQHTPTNLIGQTSLKQLAALLQQARCVISPDSGPAHIANAMGAPVIGLYATSNPERTGPYNRQYTINTYPLATHQYLNKDVEDVDWGQRVRHPDAMLLISVDMVKQKIDQVMNEIR